MAKQKAQIGAISEATLRDCDLAESYIDELKRLNPGSLAKVKAEYADLFDSDLSWEEIWDSGDDDLRDALSELVVALDLALCDECSDYIRFGAHESDGACIGFWPDLQGLAEDCRSGEVLQVSDLAEIPKGNKRLVCLVNDHGNVTLYDHSGNEIWSCV